MNLQRPENLGYTAAPDDQLNEYTICQPYVYEDGRSTGMRMIANLPIALAFTTRSMQEPIFGVYPISPHLSQNSETHNFHQLYEELPPPNYREAHLHLEDCIEIEMQEPPPPSYDECMKTEFSVETADNENTEGLQLP